MGWATLLEFLARSRRACKLPRPLCFLRPFQPIRCYPEAAPPGRWECTYEQPARSRPSPPRRKNLPVLGVLTGVFGTCRVPVVTFYCLCKYKILSRLCQRRRCSELLPSSLLALVGMQRGLPPDSSCSPLLFLPVPRINGHSKSERTARDSAMGYDSASVMSSELESSSFVDSDEDEDASR